MSLWSKRSPHTRRAYRDSLQEFLGFANGTPLREIGLGDLQAFAAPLGYQDEDGYVSHDGRAPATHCPIVATVKTLFSFAFRLGYLQANGASLVPLPQYPDDLPERILTEDETLRMIHQEPDARNRALPRLC